MTIPRIFGIPETKNVNFFNFEIQTTKLGTITLSMFATVLEVLKVCKNVFCGSCSGSTKRASRPSTDAKGYVAVFNLVNCLAVYVETTCTKYPADRLSIMFRKSCDASFCTHIGRRQPTIAPFFKNFFFNVWTFFCSNDHTLMGLRFG